MDARCRYRSGLRAAQRFVRRGGRHGGAPSALFPEGGPLLKAGGLPEKKAHATSLAVILPLAAVSAAFYLLDGALSFREAVPYLPGGFLGACAGALLMKRIPSGVLRRVFGALLLIAGVRLLLR